MYSCGEPPFLAGVEDRATSFLTGFDDPSATLDLRHERRFRVSSSRMVEAVCDRKPVMWPVDVLRQAVRREEVLVGARFELGVSGEARIDLSEPGAGRLFVRFSDGSWLTVEAGAGESAGAESRGVKVWKGLERLLGGLTSATWEGDAPGCER